MKLYLVLACAALAGAAALAQNAPPKTSPERKGAQGAPVNQAPSTVPPRPAALVPPSAAAPFKMPSGVVVPDYGTPPGATPKIIINYWDVVRDMMARVQNAPPRPVRSAGRPGDLRADYPFEEFRNLRGVDLVRAAHEGALAARSQKAGRPALEINRQVWENAAVALEYFPLLMRDDRDIQALLRIIESRQEDLELRRFVLAQLAPEQKDPSLLSMFLNDAYARYPVEFNNTLDMPISHPMENPSFQTEAMRIYHDRLMQRYRAVFAADAKVAALAKETGRAVDAAALVGEKPPAIEKATRDKLTGQGHAIAGFAKLIAAHIDINSASDAGVKTETRRILESIAAEVLVPDREAILRCLDPSRPAPPAPEGMPGMPAMPDSGSEESMIPAMPGAETGLPVMPNVSSGKQPPPTPVPLPSGL
jgi:hypothetical protein